MNRSVLLTALLLTAPAVLRAEESPAPVIFCEKPSYEFGNASASQLITHEFVLLNKGNADLNINSVRPGCGCTVANVSTQRVAPGAEARVTAQLNLAGRTGPQHKAITIDCNDPKQPQLTLMLSGTVAESINVNPPQLIFGQLNTTAPVNGEVVLSSGNGQPFKVTGTQLSLPGFTTEVVPREEGRVYAVVVTATPPLLPGTHQAMLRITTDNPTRPAIDVLVAATVVGDLVVAPNEITLAEQPGQTATRFIVLRSSNGQPFPQPVVVSPDPAIQVQIFPFGANGYRIQLSGLPAERSLDGKRVIIQTAVESMKEIAIPVRVIGAAT